MKSEFLGNVFKQIVAMNCKLKFAQVENKTNSMAFISEMFYNEIRGGGRA